MTNHCNFGVCKPVVDSDITASRTELARPVFFILLWVRGTDCRGFVSLAAVIVHRTARRGTRRSLVGLAIVSSHRFSELAPFHI